MKSILNSILCAINRKVKVLNQCFIFFLIFFLLNFPSNIWQFDIKKKHLFISIMLRKKRGIISILRCVFSGITTTTITAPVSSIRFPPSNFCSGDNIWGSFESHNKSLWKHPAGFALKGAIVVKKLWGSFKYGSMEYLGVSNQ